MRKTKLIIIFLASILLVGCKNTGADTKIQSNVKTVDDVLNEQTQSETTEEKEFTLLTSKNIKEYDNIDIDLTEMSSTIVYNTVYDMISNPEQYDGKVVKMTGQLAQVGDTNDHKLYSACVISDATACCQNGIEFVPSVADVEKFPDVGENITVVGTFSQYNIGTNVYVTLKDARIE